MQSNYNPSNPSYNPNINSDMQSCIMTDVQPNYYNYECSYYNAPVAFQNLDPRLNYVSHTTPYYPSTEVKRSLYVDAPPKYDLSLPVRQIETEQKTDDELFIETWLSKIGKIQINLDSTIEIIPCEKKTNNFNRSPMKISAAKIMTRKCMLIVKKLESTCETLSGEISSLSTIEWKDKMVAVSKLKEELTCLLSQFDNANTFALLQQAIKKRKKKRLNQYKKKLELRKLVAAEKENRKKLHEDIDHWLENMKDSVERAKMEENMQKDADCVLAEVTKKKSDARKQLSLITALIKLRNIRENVALQRGDKVSLEDRAAFSTNTVKLTNMWEDISKVYMKEEQGLRIMLEKNATEDTRHLRFSRDEKIVQKWQHVLFGPKCILSPIYCGLTFAEKDLETFIAIRRSWDTFLVANDDPRGSKIPVGWVLPSSSANVEWTKYLDG